MCVYNVSCPSFSENLRVGVVSCPCYIDWNFLFRAGGMVKNV